ncbi:hypothetical protein AVEN_219544-1 [Araneus ventricosus]|uniref:Uncharacterized protein n=1 Tax=Araneus ventricosus TaxID=182803 RepID=A0A4Y2PT75_ARAVE|nr:hypothetical protein AVEN_172553-1 [Araneus ventricosus]GBN54497.1 hypothetical protein AVEN_199754-1 [Araneus ventricosus]GBN54846.1 hypothetical protein AVEN_219544-1 [Araneus ventricosus]
MLLGIAFILGFRNTPIEVGVSCTFAANTCCRTLRRCSYILVLGVTRFIVKSVCVSFYQDATAIPFLFQLARNVSESVVSFSGSDVETLREIHNELISLSSSEESFLSKDKPLLSAVSSVVKTLEERSRTAKLCLQYFKEVSVMHYFVRAERIGDRNLHLYSIQCMLVHLHAAGNIHYTKSAHLYLQNMSNLKTSLSDQDFERFVSEGYFTVRRSDKFWCGGRLVGHNYRAGQMLSMKVGSGLSQGRNTSDGVVARWIYTMPGSLQVTEQWEVSLK